MDLPRKLLWIDGLGGLVVGGAVLVAIQWLWLFLGHVGRANRCDIHSALVSRLLGYLSLSIDPNGFLSRLLPGHPTYASRRHGNPQAFLQRDPTMGILDSG